MGVSDAVFFDPTIFRRYFKNIGRAYRAQATTLITICRLYADERPQTYTVIDGLQNVLRLADAALSAAGSAKEGTTVEATDAFKHVKEEIIRFDPPPPQKGIPDSPLETLHPSTKLELASEKDKKLTSALSIILSKASKFMPPVPSGKEKKVNFVMVESLPYEDSKDQLIMNQEIDNFTTAADIVWRLNRYPEKRADKILPKVTSRRNPHFYRHLPRDAASFDSSFHKVPLKEFSAYGFDQGDTIYIILDKSCRLFLDAAKPHIPRIFGNLWKPHETVILKDISGILDSEDTVLRNIREKQDYWHRPPISPFTDSSQHRGYSGIDREIVENPVGNGRALVDAALKSQNVDLMIRDQSRPEPPVDSGWVSHKRSYHILGSKTRQHLGNPPCLDPQLGSYPSAPSISGTTVTGSTTSIESSRTAVDDSPPRPEIPVSKRPQPGADQKPQHAPKKRGRIQVLIDMFNRK
ncbi:hypothetical protein H4582DRAFT_1972877 [Lactarius indigo]|nr:hypothetical protein H4582DRAFT_1972877 [Lactarius indigo]